MNKILNFFKKKNSRIIIFVVFIIIVAGIFYIYQAKQRKINNGGSSAIEVKKNQEVEVIIFSQNIIFQALGDSVVNIGASPNSIMIFNKDVKDFNATSYQDLLSKKTIIIQSFPALNQNKQVFENYVNQRYKTTENATTTIQLTTVRDLDAAIVTIDHPKEQYKEYAEVINLVNPVIVVASEKTSGFIKVVSTMKNIESSNKGAFEIKKQLQLIGVLIQSKMVEDLYSQFSTAYKKSQSVEDLKSSLDESKETIRYNININGGIFVKSKNQFISRPIFKSNDSNKSVKIGQLVLEKENNQWLISEFTIPRDGE